MCCGDGCAMRWGSWDGVPACPDQVLGFGGLGGADSSDSPSHWALVGILAFSISVNISLLCSCLICYSADYGAVGA